MKRFSITVGVHKYNSQCRKPRTVTIIVDEADAYIIRGSEWHCSRSPNRYDTVYRNAGGNSGTQLRQFLGRVLTGACEGMVVMHRNGNPLDYCRANLRVLTEQAHMAFVSDARVGADKLFKYLGLA